MNGSIDIGNDTRPGCPDKAESEASQCRREALLRNELRDFLNLTTHHIRSSLVNLRGFGRELEYACVDMSKALSQEENPGRAKETARRIWATESEEAMGFIQRSVDRMETYLQGLTTLVRVVCSDLTVSPCSPDPLISTIVQDLRTEARNRDVRVEVQPLPKCRADHVLLRHALYALLENAIQFSDPRKVPWVRISGTVQDGMARYLVEDNGIGMLPNECEKVVTPFYQCHPSQGPNGNHIGIGLSIAHKASILLGGELVIESEPEKGTRVWMVLPAFME